MRDISELLTEVRTSLNIPKRKLESEEEYIARLGYSLAGRWALASLNDTNSEGLQGLVSIHHFKKVFINVYSVIGQSLYSQLDLKQIAEFAYEQYGRGGFYYRQGKTLSSPLYKEGQLKDILFLRGMRVNEVVCMSGLGPYKFSDSQQTENFSNFWDLGLNSLQPLLKHYLTYAQWEPFQGNGSNVSIFNPEKSTNGFKWGDYNDQISLARTTVEPYRYFFSQIRNIDGLNQLFISYLPDFFKTEQLWMDLACAFILHYQGQVKCKIYESDDYYIIRKSELSVPNELRSLLLIYSWPLELLSQGKESSLLIKKEIIDSLKPFLEQNDITFQICS